MDALLDVLRHLTVVEVFLWSAAIVGAVLLALFIYSALSRGSRREVLHGLPPEK